MNIAEALNTLLTSSAGLTALVGTRVYPLMMPPAGTVPAVVYQRISGSDPARSLSGPSGLARPRFQIDSYARTYAEAQAVADQVRITLDGYRGDDTGVTIRATAIEDDSDEYEPDTKLYRRRQDFFIWHDE